MPGLSIDDFKQVTVTTTGSFVAISGFQTGSFFRHILVENETGGVVEVSQDGSNVWFTVLGPRRFKGLDDVHFYAPIYIRQSSGSNGTVYVTCWRGR